MSWLERHALAEWLEKRAFWSILLLAFLATICLLALRAPVAQGAAAHGQEDQFSLVLRAHENEVALLKWVGGTIVAALAAAVGVLFRGILRAQEVIVQEVKGQLEIREKTFASLSEMTAAIRALTEKLGG